MTVSVLVSAASLDTRAAISEALQALPGVEVDGCVSPAELLVRYHQRPADVVLAESPSGTTATRDLLRAVPRLHLVVVGPDDPHLAETAVAIGAAAFAPWPLDPTLLSAVLTPRTRTHGWTAPAAPIQLGSAPNPLSPRQVQVLRLAAEGVPPKKIGDRLGIGWPTVRTHFIHIGRKLDTSNRGHSIAVAFRRGLLR